ncbi:hypothetical protein EIP91_007922 [Steccherinum ochraceum]|uniref:Uncharacterized protein n=1 Tax=Steccherinum ochraceum TaxID=92696 RepID=A0A4R0RNW4_9APHY|nr:hypothetical protein EIP91_007922 [Steccherinum ochraceum]
MALRAPTPSRSTPQPSSRPADYAASIEAAAKKQAHVDELIVRTRTLEHTVEKIKTAKAAEEARHKDGVQKLQQQWEEERREWKHGCDILQSAHRIAHLKTAVDRDTLKLEGLKEKEKERRERLKRLQRDFRLVIFQVHEARQERRVQDLEDTLEVEREEHQEELREVREKLSEGVAGVQERFEALEVGVSEKTAEIQSLRKEKKLIEARPFICEYMTHSISSSGPNAFCSGRTSELERASLRYETLKTGHSQLDDKYKELKASYDNSAKQLEKWSDLENRDSTELESLRAQKLKLDITVKDLQNQLENAKKNGADVSQAKVEKWKKSVEEYREALDEAHKNASNYESDVQRLEAAVAKANDKITKLRERLEAEKEKRSELESAVGTSRPHTTLSPIPGSDAEVEEIPSPKQSKPRSKAKPPSRTTRRAQSKQPETSPDVEDEEPPAASKPKPKSKRQTEEDSDAVEEVPAPTRKPRSKKVSPSSEDSGPSKPKPKRGRPKKSPEAAESDVEEVVKAKPPVKKGKTKVPEIIIEEEVEEEDADEVQARPAQRKRKKPDDEEVNDVRKSAEPAAAKSRKGRPPKVKPPSRQASVARATSKALESIESDEEADVGSQPKKKRKINLFPTAQPQTFDWGNLNQGGGGLNIPTDLSPVKDNDAIPPRSTSRLGSAFGPFSQAGRR